MTKINHDSEQDQQFCSDLVALAPRMRSFALSLCRNGVQADDLVQDTMLKAWEFRAHYQTGTVLQAWMYTILRNRFLDDKRRSWRSCPLEPDVAENTLVAISDPDKILELDEMRRALGSLKTEQREAVMLIGAGGFAYNEAAAICGATVGTIKSRTSRARVKLREILDTGAYKADGESCGAAMSMILSQVDKISSRAPSYA